MDNGEYKAQISRINPTCLIFLIDQSASMNKPFGRQPAKKKAEGVAEILNNILENLTIRCAKDGGIYDYLHLGVIGYGAQIGSILQGPLQGEKVVTIGKLGLNQLRIQETTTIAKDPLGREVKKTTRKPIWIEPHAAGDTPLAEALLMAADWVKGFIAQHPKCFPPLVINLTDGMPTKPHHPGKPAKELCEIKSEDGRVLLFNVHITEETADPIAYPDREELLPPGDPGKFARFLFKLSSVLPRKYIEMARAAEIDVKEESRGFVFNADFGSLQKFLDFGTKTQQAPRPDR